LSMSRSPIKMAAFKLVLPKSKQIETGSMIVSKYIIS
jgi:hypothetical protein